MSKIIYVGTVLFVLSIVAHIEDLFCLWVSGFTVLGVSTLGSCPDIQLLSLQVCLVGKSRNYELPDEAEAERQRANYVQSRRTASGVTVQVSDIRNDCCHGSKDTDRTPGSNWGAGFQPRDRVETVRNCAALPRDFVDAVVLQVANVLLGMTEDGSGGSSCGWNRGGKPRQPQNTRDKDQQITQVSMDASCYWSDEQVQIKSRVGWHIICEAHWSSLINVHFGGFWINCFVISISYAALERD